MHPTLSPAMPHALDVSEAQAHALIRSFTAVLLPQNLLCNSGTEAGLFCLARSQAASADANRREFKDTLRFPEASSMCLQSSEPARCVYVCLQRTASEAAAIRFLHAANAAQARREHVSARGLDRAQL